MRLIEVNTTSLENEFILFPVRLYKNEQNWIRPLDKDIRDIFDINKNKLFKQGGKCIRWILKDVEGVTIGRVAAFINPKANKKEEVPTGGIGFFECIEDQEAANTLFDAGKRWLEAQGIEAMDGSVNFGERDKWWGVLVDGFSEPNYCMPWNFPYYASLFENYGFQLYFKQFTYHRPVKNLDFDPRMYQRGEHVLNDSDFEFRYLEGAEMKKAPEYFVKVYNQAWAGHDGGGKELSLMMAKQLFKSMGPIMDKRLIYFGFHKGEPISFFISIPEINQIFKYLDGQMNWLGKLKFLYYKMTKPNRKMLGLVFGVVPKYQGKGIESAMIIKYTDLAWSKDYPYEDIELNWIGDFNPKMMKVAEQIGAKVKKTHHTYRYLFDRTREFKRAKSI
ncbi:hypothetical protein [Penaeicola halotolerans]|uniref:hypothetical protein n=1 Tax=Penaeicola halotolerans TaxID=2793196 RepID=UPI001CF91F83|nr:hypothetical protein [Penaeicola halotolerans]